MNVALFLLMLAATLSWGAWIVVRTTRTTRATNRRINADVAFLRAIPSDMSWSDE